MAKNKTSKKSSYKVFMSHATSDKWIATVFCEKLKQVGVSTFIDDRDIDGGDNIPSVIRDHLESSDEFLVLLTPSSISRPWVQFEIGAAWGMKKRIMLIWYLVSFESIPDITKTEKVYNLNDFNRYVEELSERVKT